MCVCGDVHHTCMCSCVFRCVKHSSRSTLAQDIRARVHTHMQSCPTISVSSVISNTCASVCVCKHVNIVILRVACAVCCALCDVCMAGDCT